jgi:hypothetical protein
MQPDGEGGSYYIKYSELGWDQTKGTKTYLQSPIETDTPNIVHLHYQAV